MIKQQEHTEEEQIPVLSNSMRDQQFVLTTGGGGSAVFQEETRQFFKLAREEKIKAVSTLIGGTIFLMFPGCLYITGVISPYIKSYYQLPEENQMALNIMPMA